MTGAGGTGDVAEVGIALAVPLHGGADVIAMVISVAVLGAAYAMIFSEVIHRTYAAIAGAVLMVVLGTAFGFYSQADALNAIDANTILLLMGMMLLIAMLRHTGLFQYLAIRVAKSAAGSPKRLLVYLGLAVSVLSMVLDNVTTVIIFAPLTVLVTRLLHLNPMPYLIAEAMLSNIGGAATLVGDPPNIIIGSAAGIDFVTFLVNMAPLVILPWLATLALLMLFFRETFQPHTRTAADIVLDESKAIKDPVMLRRMLVVMALVIGLFFIHHHLHYYPAFVSLIGLGLALVLIHPQSDKLIKEVEWSILLFFAALFVIVGGVEGSGLLGLAGAYLADLAQDPGRMLLAALALMWMAAFASAIIDNIPFTVTMVPIITALSAEGLDVFPLWWALAIGVALGGNGTHLGATANIIVVAQAESSGIEGARITPGQWVRVGAPIVVAGLLLASAVFTLVHFTIGWTAQR